MGRRRQHLVRAAALVAAAVVAAAGCGSSGGSKGSGSGSVKSADLDAALRDAAAVKGDQPEQDAVQFRQAQAGSGQGLKIGYVSLGENVPFGKLVSDGVRKQAQQAGAEFVLCDSQGDAAKALACVKNFKTQGVQGYLNFQPDAKAAGSICAAGPQGPVIAIDIHQAPCEKAFMGANNSYAGYLAGTALGQYFKKLYGCKYDAFVSMEEPDAGQVNKDRMGGYQTGFAKVCGKIHNLRTENAFRIDQARTTFTDVLTALPGAHKVIVVAINDDALEGALAAARTANREDDLYLAGQGADPSAWCEMKKNKQWVADTAYFPERYGEIGVPYLIELLRGKTVPQHLYVPHQIVNGSNIDATYHPTGCS
jgi:ribose transport system substrate-binding protein